MYQIGALEAFCRAAGVPLYHVKPHGAFYNMAAKDYELALAICEGMAAIDPKLVLLGLSNSQMEKAAKAVGIPFKREVFADRAYEEDGSLVARSKPGSMIEDEELAIKRIIGMIKKGTVISISGKEIEVQADSICVHGDGSKALEFVKTIRRVLKEEGIEVKAF